MNFDNRSYEIMISSAFYVSQLSWFYPKPLELRYIKNNLFTTPHRGREEIMKQNTSAAVGREEKYFFSAALAAFLKLTIARMGRGLGACLYLLGLPGCGKTSFARAIARELGASFYHYKCNSDERRNLLYDTDVDGVLKREQAWVKGKAWRAFEDSANGQYAVLLLDEFDKASDGFIGFLLTLLEEWHFDDPQGNKIQADPSKICVVITSNGNKDPKPEMLRRCQRIEVPLPTGDRLHQIMDEIAGQQLPTGLRDLVIRLGDSIRASDAGNAGNAPSPKEMALCCLDMLQLGVSEESVDNEIYRQVAASWLVKKGGPQAIDKVIKYNWAKGLRTEAQR